MGEKKRACCVFGHRKVPEKDSLKGKLSAVFENLIVNENVDTFYLGSSSQFDDLCRELLSHKKEIYPHIQRIYVRAEYPYISEDYEKYLLESCDKTYFPEKSLNAGRAVYTERNYEMINNSDICVIYFENDKFPSDNINGKSGTALAFKYAVQKKKIIINLFCQK